jgi:hypothetical protein
LLHQRLRFLGLAPEISRERFLAQFGCLGIFRGNVKDGVPDRVSRFALL